MKTKLTAKLVALTQPTTELREASAEGFIAYCARVSNPEYQDKELGTLLQYCIKNRHWSIFEMADATVVIEAPRDISRQGLRHWSFDFQEFSQRYSSDFEFTVRELRGQDTDNRQNSIDIFDDTSKREFEEDCALAAQIAKSVYDKWISRGAAKECARVFLPEGLTMSRLYMKGSLRSWLHYLDVRDDEGVTQLEHVYLARKIRECLLPAFPRVFGFIEKDKA